MPSNLTFKVNPIPASRASKRSSPKISRKRGEVGAAVAVTLDGRPMIDLWAGHADAARTKSMGARYSRQRMVHHQGTVRPLCPSPGRSGQARFRCARRQVLAGVCRRRQRQYPRQISAQSQSRAWPRFVPRSSSRNVLVGQGHHRTGPSGAMVGAGNKARLSRDNFRMAGRRSRSPHLRQEPRHLFSRGDRRSARRRRLYWPARGSRFARSRDRLPPLRPSPVNMTLSSICSRTPLR